jgi:hypothetical protein
VGDTREGRPPERPDRSPLTPAELRLALTAEAMLREVLERHKREIQQALAAVGRDQLEAAAKAVKSYNALDAAGIRARELAVESIRFANIDMTRFKEQILELLRPDVMNLASQMVAAYGTVIRHQASASAELRSSGKATARLIRADGTIAPEVVAIDVPAALQWDAGSLFLLIAFIAMLGAAMAAKSNAELAAALGFIASAAWISQALADRLQRKG